MLKQYNEKQKKMSPEEKSKKKEEVKILFDDVLKELYFQLGLEDEAGYM